MSKNWASVIFRCSHSQSEYKNKRRFEEEMIKVVLYVLCLRWLGYIHIKREGEILIGREGARTGETEDWIILKKEKSSKMGKSLEMSHGGRGRIPLWNILAADRGKNIQDRIKRNNPKGHWKQHEECLEREMGGGIQS